MFHCLNLAPNDKSFLTSYFALKPQQTKKYRSTYSNKTGKVYF